MKEGKHTCQNFDSYKIKQTKITHVQLQNDGKILESQNKNVKNQKYFFYKNNEENIQNTNLQEKNQKNSENEDENEIFGKNSYFSSEYNQQNQQGMVQLQNDEFNQQNIRISQKCDNSQKSNLENAKQIEIQQNSIDDLEFKKINDKMIQIYENQIGKQQQQLKQLSEKLPSYVIFEEYFQQKKEFLGNQGQAVPVLNQDISDSFLILKRELHFKAIMIKKLKDQADINQHIKQSLYKDIQISDKIIKDVYQL
ncbi:hypothetical protein PPERSA_11075 [Pseudocohnilembus persalinus]|uniref:Uncharacterized protein n=1 Tax=Pseudocohnilembus persalinus TaxID=266149 RepID=A0A0V0QZ40_PSEPJ|nr:hypothetical protein PPERSA_11075 [Pseudocohnilembus persalinus]|eukprot:KRX07526.1 hypothetical protein PPERSA_11075 [Pseudocohnilembus persalinus]